MYLYLPAASGSAQQQQQQQQQYGPNQQQQYGPNQQQQDGSNQQQQDGHNQQQLHATQLSNQQMIPSPSPSTMYPPAGFGFAQQQQLQQQQQQDGSNQQQQYGHNQQQLHATQLSNQQMIPSPSPSTMYPPAGFGFAQQQQLQQQQQQQDGPNQQQQYGHNQQQLHATQLSNQQMIPSPSPSTMYSPAGFGSAQQQQLQQQQQQGGPNQRQRHATQLSNPQMLPSPSPRTMYSPTGFGFVRQQQGGPNQQQQQHVTQLSNPQIMPSPWPSTMYSPAGFGSAQQQQQGGPNQQQRHATQLSNPQMIPSPTLAPSFSPQVSNLSTALNTPGPVARHSRFNLHDDRFYWNKYYQLAKYIEPLKRVVAKIRVAESNTNTDTLTKILDILINPSPDVPYQTLLKCEKVLKRMEGNTRPHRKSSNPFMEAINTTLQSPNANHTLHRTFRPTLELMFDTDICAPAPAKIPRLAEKPSQFELEIPHVLQGEIARLDQKFKVTLDTAAQSNAKSIKLVCGLDDKHLPNVPPISVNIPEEYPWISPDCSLAQFEYSGTPFLKAVQDNLIARIAKLPKCHSLSHLLDSWEMSVRQACSPTAKPTACDFTSIFNV